MKKRVIRHGVAFFAFGILLFSVFHPAAAKDSVRFQGKLMELDLIQHRMIVNEKPVVWNQDTVFHNERNFPITIYKLKAKSWVFVEGDYDKGSRRLVAKKIYLLPKRVAKNEQHLYPFME